MLILYVLFLMLVSSFDLELCLIYVYGEIGNSFCMTRFNALKHSWEYKSLLALIEQYLMKGPITEDKVGLALLDVVSINLE
jgi:hypothetical protein